MFMEKPSPRTAGALEVRGLTVSYRDKQVLRDVDAMFPVGKLSAVVGPNGAGKSTLVRAALGLIPSDTGQVRIAGRSLSAGLRHVAYVPQRESVDWDFPITVGEVVAMGRYREVGWFRRLRRDDRAIVGECLERVGMAGYARRQIGQLSGGQQQRVFFARALAQRADVLVLDEPFAGIDAKTRSGLLTLLGELRDEGASIIVVHHDIDEVRAIFDWVLLLNVSAAACGHPARVLDPEAVRLAYRGPEIAVGGELEWTG